ncbi:MAG: hypothetical protein HC908_14320 [Calothrix sp. SM1_7_51]|nr:hypothetical protein [Calothrix sp. SM1_7_51]
MSGANDYLSSIYPGYLDPTQIPIKPGDTERAMHDVQPFSARTGVEYAATNSTRRQMLEDLRREMAESLFQVNAPRVAQEIPVQSSKNQSITIDINLNINLNINVNRE